MKEWACVFLGDVTSERIGSAGRVTCYSAVLAVHFFNNIFLSTSSRPHESFWGNNMNKIGIASVLCSLLFGSWSIHSSFVKSSIHKATTITWGVCRFRSIRGCQSYADKKVEELEWGRLAKHWCSQSACLLTCGIGIRPDLVGRAHWVWKEHSERGLARRQVKSEYTRWRIDSCARVEKPVRLMTCLES